MSNACNLCPNKCNIDRNISFGACGVSNKVKIAKYYLHQFEEDIISGKNGSGTIFFSGCSLKCVYCQNFIVSRNKTGKEISINQLAEIFKFLEDNGACNINLVNPTHFSNEIIKALDIYKPNIPIVYNTHGYERVDVLEKIDSYIDVYLPDIKYFSPEISYKYSKVKDYFFVASKAIEFMAKKPLILQDGLLKKGTLVRHLVLPLNTFDSKKIIDWFVTLKDKAYLNIMSQYTPFGEIENFKELNRKLTKREYDSVLNYAMDKKINNLYYQELKSSDKVYIPKWDF